MNLTTTSSRTTLHTRTITVIGASHGTGAATAARARDLGASVRAVSRSGGSSTARIDRVRVDATDTAALDPIIGGSDAVFVMVGAPGRDRSRIRTRVTAAVLASMHRTGVRRLIAQSSLGVGDSIAHVGLVEKLVVFPFLLAPAIADHTEQEGLVEASDTDWTILRPGYLRDASTGGRTVGVFGHDGPAFRPRVARADLANWALSAIDNRDTVGRRVIVATAR